MRCLRVLALALILAACTPAPDGIEIVTNGETPIGPTPSTTSSQKPPRTIALPPPTGGIGDITLIRRFNEAIRLTSFVVSPTLIDPRFLGGNAALLLYRDNLVDEALPGYGYVTGVAVSRKPETNAKDKAELAVTVSIFKDDASATAATEALYRLRDEQSSPGKPKHVRSVEIPNFPDARAFASSSGQGELAFTETRAYVQRGSLVIKVSVADRPDEESIDLIGRYLAQQLTELTAFTPTPIDQLSTLTAPFDPDGTLDKLVADSNSINPGGLGGVFDTKGALLYRSDIQSWSAVYRDAGVDRLIIGESERVIRAADEAGSAQVFEADRSDFHSKTDYEPTGPPASIPSADCTQYVARTAEDDPLQWCRITRGRYVAWINSKRSNMEAKAQEQLQRLG